MLASFEGRFFMICFSVYAARSQLGAMGGYVGFADIA